MESWVHESDSNLSQLRIKFRRCQHRNGIRRRVCSNVQEDHGSPVFAVAPPCHLEPPHLPPLLPSQGRHTSNQSHLCLPHAQSQRSLLPLGTLNRTATGTNLPVSGNRWACCVQTEHCWSLLKRPNDSLAY